MRSAERTDILAQLSQLLISLAGNIARMERKLTRGARIRPLPLVYQFSHRPVRLISLALNNPALSRIRGDAKVAAAAAAASWKSPGKFAFPGKRELR